MSEKSTEEKQEGDDFWDNEWITEENIAKLVEKDMVTAPVDQIVVGLFTLDNAMQNIALQLKLKLITPSNKLIK